MMLKANFHNEIISIMNNCYEYCSNHLHKTTTGCEGKYINTLVIAESNIPPSYDRPSGQKINKDIKVLKNIIHKVGLVCECVCL